MEEIGCFSFILWLGGTVFIGFIKELAEALTIKDWIILLLQTALAGMVIIGIPRLLWKHLKNDNNAIGVPEKKGLGEPQKSKNDNNEVLKIFIAVLIVMLIMIIVIGIIVAVFGANVIFQVIQALMHVE